jgi:hypothetical protein
VGSEKCGLGETPSGAPFQDSGGAWVCGSVGVWERGERGEHFP